MRSIAFFTSMRTDIDTASPAGGTYTVTLTNTGDADFTAGNPAVLVDADTGEAVEPVEEVQEAVVQCLDCLHDQPHLALIFYEEDGRRVSRIEPIEDRWERMVTGTPWVASCTVSVDADQVESCSGPEAAESLAFAAFGDHGTREFFTHVRFHKHEEDSIVIHMLVELYSRSADEATDVMEGASRGKLTITSLAEESRPPASSGDVEH